MTLEHNARIIVVNNVHTEVCEIVARLNKCMKDIER